jgi:hypothetical protein
MFAPTPLTWKDPSIVPRRRFAYGRHYSRKYLGVTVAQTKVGKSSLALVEALAMASGKQLLGVTPNRRMKIWYWNGEDPREELERRVAAICLHYGLTADDIDGNLYVDSGRDMEIAVATQGKTGALVSTDVVDGLIGALTKGKFDVLILDPAISTHRTVENDNGAIDIVAKAFARIAEDANVAVEVASHTRKLGGAAATIEDARGASAWTSAARDVRVLNRMSRDEGEKAGIEAGKERSYFRADTEGNLTPATATEWFKLASVGLGNGNGDGPEDNVGVVTPWTWPNALDGFSASDLRKAQAAVAKGRWRANPRAADWVGIPVAKALGLDPSRKMDRAKVIGALKIWTANGMFVAVEGTDSTRHVRTFIEVCDAASD